MSLPKLPPPPRNPQSISEVNDWQHRLYEFLGKSGTDGLANVNGKLTMRAADAPPAPVVAQQTLSIPIGSEFSFNFIQNATVDGYWIYKNSVNDPNTASRYKFVPQSASQGIYTFQDTTGQGVSAYYWVASINNRGESSKTAMGGSTSLTPTQVNTIYRPTTSTGSGYSSAQAAYDANQNVGATAFVGTRGSRTTTWLGFAAAVAVPSSVTLKAVSQATFDFATGFAELEYSVDGGSSWSTIYVQTSDFSQSDSIVLLPAQDLTLVQVRATASLSSPSPGDSVTHQVLEIWIEVVV